MATQQSNHQHTVEFYGSDHDLAGAVTRYLARGFKSGNPMIVIATAEHWQIFNEDLASSDFAVEQAIRSGQLTILDAHETLERFLDSDEPHPERFRSVVGSIIQNACTDGQQQPVLAYGEMVDVLWQTGRHAAAIRLEELWNELGATHPFELFCAYSLNGFYREDHNQGFADVCCVHSHVIPDSLALRAEIEHRKRLEKALLDAIAQTKNGQRAESFLSAIVESADDAIVTKTLDGIITSWNASAERIFGYTADEVIGKPITILIPPELEDEEPSILSRLRRGIRIEHFETRRVRKDGRMIDISLTVSPVRDSKGKIIGASKIARDVTLQKRLQAERDTLLKKEQHAREEAEAANRVKDEFLAVLSHELRTPLNAVLGWMHILESRRDEDVVLRAVEVIKRNVTIQQRMIEDLLDLASVLSGKFHLKNERVDLRCVVEAAIDSVTPAASLKGITLEKAIDDCSSPVLGDPDRLQQVVWNLLSNSIKFTPANGIVRLSLLYTSSQLELMVKDSGQGIKREFLPHIFERFRQADTSTTRQHGGLGLGLAVVRHIVEAHGGVITADSEGEGRGATFTIRIPRLATASAA